MTRTTSVYAASYRLVPTSWVAKAVAAGPYLANHAISNTSRINPTTRLMVGRGCHVRPELARAPRRERDRPKLRSGMASPLLPEQRTDARHSAPRHEGAGGPI